MRRASSLRRRKSSSLNCSVAPEDGIKTPTASEGVAEICGDAGDLETCGASLACWLRIAWNSIDSSPMKIGRAMTDSTEMSAAVNSEKLDQIELGSEVVKDMFSS